MLTTYTNYHNYGHHNMAVFKKKNSTRPCTSSMWWKETHWTLLVRLKLLPPLWKTGRKASENKLITITWSNNHTSRYLKNSWEQDVKEGSSVYFSTIHNRQDVGNNKNIYRRQLERVADQHGYISNYGRWRNLSGVLCKLTYR